MEKAANPPLLSLLSDDMINAIVAVGEQRRYQDGQIIHSRGSDRRGLSIILSGRVRFGIFSEDGAYFQTSLLGVGHCFGEATLFADMPRAYDAEAVDATMVLEINASQFDQLLVQNPGISKALLVTLTSRLYEALDFADDLRRLPVDAKVAKHLLRFANTAGFSSDVIPIRQTDLAYALGMSRVTIGKSLEALSEKGLIGLGYGEIRVTDHAGLVRLIRENEAAR